MMIFLCLIQPMRSPNPAGFSVLLVKIYLNKSSSVLSYLHSEAALSVALVQQRDVDRMSCSMPFLLGYLPDEEAGG